MDDFGSDSVMEWCMVPLASSFAFGDKDDITELNSDVHLVTAIKNSPAKSCSSSSVSVIDDDEIAETLSTQPSVVIDEDDAKRKNMALPESSIVNDENENDAKNMTLPQSSCQPSIGIDKDEAVHETTPLHTQPSAVIEEKGDTKNISLPLSSQHPIENTSSAFLHKFGNKKMKEKRTEDSSKRQLAKKRRIESPSRIQNRILLNEICRTDVKLVLCLAALTAFISIIALDKTEKIKTSDMNKVIIGLRQENQLLRKLVLSNTKKENAKLNSMLQKVYRKLEGQENSTKIFERRNFEFVASYKEEINKLKEQVNILKFDYGKFQNHLKHAVKYPEDSADSSSSSIKGHHEQALENNSRHEQAVENSSHHEQVDTKESNHHALKESVDTQASNKQMTSDINRLKLYNELITIFSKELDILSKNERIGKGDKHKDACLFWKDIVHSIKNKSNEKNISTIFSDMVKEFKNKSISTIFFDYMKTVKFMGYKSYESMKNAYFCLSQTFNKNMAQKKAENVKESIIDLIKTLEELN